LALVSYKLPLPCMWGLNVSCHHLKFLTQILFKSHRSLIPIQVGFDECFARFSSCHFVTVSVPLSQNKHRCPHHIGVLTISNFIPLWLLRKLISNHLVGLNKFIGQIMESTGLLGVFNITIYACSIDSTWLYIVVPWGTLTNVCQIILRIPFQQVVWHFHLH
jgi:hypothetical protein